MKQAVEKRETRGVLDHFALALTTFGVGYIPGAPGTYGSIVGLLIYLGIDQQIDSRGDVTTRFATLATCFIVFCLIGIWAATRSIELLGNADPSEAVVDEVMGQLITFAFIPFGAGWGVMIAGFFLFRLFDIIKPYPCRRLERLPGGLGICADDLAAGVYAGACLLAATSVYRAL